MFGFCSVWITTNVLSQWFKLYSCSPPYAYMNYVMSALALLHPYLPTQSTWWRHPMETSSALLALCAGNLPATGVFPTQGPVTRSFDVFFDLRPNKRLSKHSWGWWFETPSRSLWRQRNNKAGLYLRVRFSGVGCHYLVSLVMLLLMSYFIMAITSFTDLFMSMVTPFELQIQASWN